MTPRFLVYATIAKWVGLVAWWGAAAAACLVVLGARLGLPWPDAACQAPLCDVSHFWQVARMAASGHAADAYDPAIFAAMRLALLGPGADVQFWFYPPPAILAVAGLAGFSLAAAFWVWTVGLMILAVLMLRAAGIAPLVIVIGLLSPAGLWNAELGQFGGLAGAGLVAGLVAARPLAAGLALGVLVVKPQAALLAPVALLAAGRGRACLAAGLIGGALTAASYAVFGAAVWRGYFGPGMATLHAQFARLSVTPGTAAFGVSVFGMLRSFGASVGVAGAGQGCLSCLAIAATAWLWRRGPFGSPRLVLRTTILALLATPYGYVDDMVGVSLALVMCVRAAGWRFSLTDMLLFTWPALSPGLYHATGWQLTPPLLALALWRSGRGASPETTPAAAGPAARGPAAE